MAKFITVPPEAQIPPQALAPASGTTILVRRKALFLRKQYAQMDEGDIQNFCSVWAATGHSARKTGQSECEGFTAVAEFYDGLGFKADAITQFFAWIYWTKGWLMDDSRAQSGNSQGL